MSHQLICPVDGSRSSRAAARLAARLGERLGLKVALLHATGPAPAPVASRHPAVAPPDRQLVREAAVVDGHRIIAALAEEAGLPEEGHHVAPGDAADVACDVARAGDAELVVVGSRGERGLKSAVLGSVSRALAENAPCPVVVVPPGAVAREERLDPDAGGTGPIVCAIAAHDGPQLALLAAGLADALDRPLLLAHVADHDDGGAALEPLHGAADAVRAGAPLARGCEIRLLAGQPGRELAALAGREQAELVVVGPPRRTGLGAAVFGSTATHLASEGDSPILVAR